MRETISLLLATTVLGLGGLGLYLFKTNESKGGGSDYDEDEIFKNDKAEADYSVDDEEDYDDEEYDKKARKRTGKTKRSRKASGTKRRY